MGRKEWLYWGGGGGGTGAGKSRKGSSTTTANNLPPPPPSSSSSSSSNSGGCMSAIFQLFDLHQFQFQQNPFIPSDPNNLFTNITPDEELPNTHIVLKGVEAPRNSLEMEELASSSSCSPSSSSPPEIKLDIQMGIQIKTGRSRLLASSDECNSTLSCSPGTKTPSLVARLMGLDLLPDQISSPRPSSSSNYSTTTPNLKSSSSSSSSHHHHRHSRSLPETPRVSTASGRRSTDATDYHHRLSLQIPDKENHYHTFTSPTTTTTRGGEETSHYAKQILKQVRENVSMRRSVGADITNTVMTNRKKEQRRDENLVVLLKSKKTSSSSSSSVDDHINHQPTSLSFSPRLRFLENKNKPTSVPPSNINISAPLPIINEVKGPSPKAPKSQPPLMAKEKPMQKQQKLQEEDKLVKKCKKIASERYDVRVKKLHQHQQKKKKQEEPFVKLTFADKKSKKPSSTTTPTPLMPNTKFLSFKKNPSQKQVPHESITQLPRSQSQSYSSKATPTLTVRDDHDLNAAAISTTTAAKAAVGFEYISRILNYIGIYENTPISTTHWHSPSHPLNPSIFHHLELSSHTVTTQRSERKLMFELVNEILVDIVKPYIDFRPWVRCGSRKFSNGHQLFDEMCKRVTSYPGADCKVLEDIDAVIDTDLGRGSTREQRKMALEEEAERIIMEIEGDIVEKLVHETLMW